FQPFPSFLPNALGPVSPPASLGPIFPGRAPSGTATSAPAVEGSTAQNCLQRLSRPDHLRTVGRPPPPPSARTRAAAPPSPGKPPGELGPDLSRAAAFRARTLGPGS